MSPYDSSCSRCRSPCASRSRSTENCWGRWCASSRTPLLDGDGRARSARGAGAGRAGPSPEGDQKRHVERGLPPGESGAVTVIHRANSDLRLNPHLHTIFLDGVYAPDRDGKGQMFHPAPAPAQQEVEAIVARASKRILRFLQRRGVITLVAAPGDGEVSVVTDDALGEEDPLLARLLAAATAGCPPAGPANKRKPLRIVLDPDDRPIAKGTLCAQEHGFNLQAATRVAANDKPGRLTLCRYILSPPLANDRLTILDANDRLKILDDGDVSLQFKKPWSDGTASVELAPLALIARLAALVVPAGPRACPPCPCPTRLRRARRRPLAAIPSDILGYSRHTAPRAARWSQRPSLRRSPSRTSPRKPQNMSGGLSFCAGFSRSRLSARSAKHGVACSA